MMRSSDATMDLNMDHRALLFHLADDAFEVMNWARREGMKRDKQLEQVVEAYEKTLTDNGYEIVPKKIGAALLAGLNR